MTTDEAAAALQARIAELAAENAELRELLRWRVASSTPYRESTQMPEYKRIRELLAHHVADAGNVIPTVTGDCIPVPLAREQKR